MRRVLALHTLASLTLLACSDPGVPPPAVDAGRDAAPITWATYRIDVGLHSAMLEGATDAHPLRNLTMVDGRDYQFAFDPSAAYVLTEPVDPADQLDWNKLPGLSDCDTVDLSVDGAMFGWRWRLDLTPQVLEVTAYANNAGVHLTPPEPLLTLDAAELASDTPLRYRVWSDGDVYVFTIAGTLGPRAIDVATTLPRRCPTLPAETWKWASGLYFGGTSTAPSVITGRILETAFAVSP